jgi:hypothetical protein
MGGLVKCFIHIMSERYAPSDTSYIAMSDRTPHRAETKAMQFSSSGFSPCNNEFATFVPTGSDLDDPYWWEILDIFHQPIYDSPVLL